MSEAKPSDTPETDAVFSDCEGDHWDSVIKLHEHARKMERARNEALRVLFEAGKAHGELLLKAEDWKTGQAGECGVKQIWKFKFILGHSAGIIMPQGAEVLTVQVQDGHVCLWAIVAPNAPSLRKFHVVGTGCDLPEELGRYVGTVQTHGMVWHVFEGLDE